METNGIFKRNSNKVSLVFILFFIFSLLYQAHIFCSQYFNKAWNINPHELICACFFMMKVNAWISQTDVWFFLSRCRLFSPTNRLISFIFPIAKRKFLSNIYHSRTEFRLNKFKITVSLLNIHIWLCMIIHDNKYDIKYHNMFSNVLRTPESMVKSTLFKTLINKSHSVIKYATCIKQ